MDRNTRVDQPEPAVRRLTRCSPLNYFAQPDKLIATPATGGGTIVQDDEIERT